VDFKLEISLIAINKFVKLKGSAREPLLYYRWVCAGSFLALVMAMVRFSFRYRFRFGTTIGRNYSVGIKFWTKSGKYNSRRSLGRGCLPLKGFCKKCSWHSRYNVYVFRFAKDTDLEETTTPWINSLRLVINRVDDLDNLLWSSRFVSPADAQPLSPPRWASELRGRQWWWCSCYRDYPAVEK